MKERIELYLKSKNETTEVVKATKLAGGASAETFLVDANWVNEGVKEDLGLVFKINQESGVLGAGSDQVEEYKIMECLMNTDVLTPKVYWVEDDPKWLGAPFLVMEKIDGSTSLTEVFSNEEKKVSMSRQLVEQIAKLHLVDVKEVGLSFLGLPTRDIDCALNEIEKWVGLYRQYTIFPNPAIEEMIVWLKDNAPEKATRVSILWGDPGPGNFMHKNDKITALIDWEMAHIGDPMDEIGMLLCKLETSGQMMTEEEFFTYYEEYSGIKINRKIVDYYKVLWYLRIATISAIALKEFNEAKTNNIFTGYTGAQFLTTEVRKAFEQIQKIEEGEFYVSNIG